MLKRLLPRKETFFHYFQQAADRLSETSLQFSKMLQHLDHQQYYVDVIARYEEEADQIAHANFELLHKTFITPFDRHDIHQLTTAIDDTIDLINRIAQRFPFYHLKSIPDEAIKLALLSSKATDYVKSSIYCLSSLKNAAEIFKQCNEIDRVESEAHQVVLTGERNLFMYEEDFKQFFKIKEIFAHTKLVINRCQDIANILKGIVLEYS